MRKRIVVESDERYHHQRNPQARHLKHQAQGGDVEDEHHEDVAYHRDIIIERSKVSTEHAVCHQFHRHKQEERRHTLMERKHLLPYHILYQDESDEMETSHRKPTGFPNHQEQEEMERDDDQLDECRKQIGNHTSSIYHTAILWTKIVFHKLNQSYYTRTKLFHTQILFSVTAAKIDIFLDTSFALSTKKSVIS